MGREALAVYQVDSLSSKVPQMALSEDRCREERSFACQLIKDQQQGPLDGTVNATEPPGL